MVGQLLDYAQYHISFEELFFQARSREERRPGRRGGSKRKEEQRGAKEAERRQTEAERRCLERLLKVRE